MCIMEIIQLNNKSQYKIIQTIQIKDIYGSAFRELFKVIEGKENELITIYINGNHTKKQMTIWRLNNHKNYEIHCQIKGIRLYNILKLNKNEFVVYEDISIYCLPSINYHEEQLVFRDLNKYNIIAKIGKFRYKSKVLRYYDYFENMCLLSNDMLCIAETLKDVYLIKISTHEKISKYLTYPGLLSSMFKLDNNIILIIGNIEVKKEKKYGKYIDEPGFYKDYISIYRYNDEEFVEILDQDNPFKNDQENYYLGTKYKNDLIACSCCNKIQLKKIKI